MENSNFLSERIQELRQKISVIEWDFNNIDNTSIKAKKKDSLERYKTELDSLLKLENFEKTK